MHKILRLHPHRHTGKVLHHRHTSYRALVLVVLLAGACMLLTAKLARASSYNVTAKISAPLPAGAPVISSPADGSTFDTPNITVTGSCPISSPAILVVVYEGTTALGSTRCSVIGTFSVPITLHDGAQQLVATVVNITDDVGDSSEPFTVSYVPRPETITVTQPSSNTRTVPGSRTITRTPRGSGEQTLEIRSRSPFLVYGPSKPAVWEGSFAGGTTPYTVNIAWGDGKTTWIKDAGRNLYSISHPYDEVRPSYRITITLRDNAGHELQMRITAVSPAIATGGTLQTPDIGLQLPFSRPLYFIYLLTILVLASLWAIEHNNARRLALAKVKAPARRITTKPKRKRRA